MKQKHPILSLFRLVLLSALLSSCTLPAKIFQSGATIHYVGETFSAKEAVETYYDVQDVKRPYKVVGRMTNDIVLQYEVESLKLKMQEKAKQVGADAIIFTDLAPARVTDELDKIILKAIVVKYL